MKLLRTILAGAIPMMWAPVVIAKMEKAPVPVKASEDTAKPKLPKIFASHDFDGNNRIDLLEAIELFNDKSIGTPFNADSNGDDKITKDERDVIVEWFHKVSRLSNVDPRVKALCLDIAADVHKQLDDKGSIPKPLPRVIDKSDANKDRQINPDEAISLYESRTKNKLERDEQGQLTSSAFRQLIDAFNHPSTGQLNIKTWTAIAYCYAIKDFLLEQYRAKYGPYDPDAADKGNIITSQDEITKSN